MKLPLDLIWETIEGLARTAVINFERALGPGTGEEKKKQAVSWVWEQVHPFIPDRYEWWLKPLALAVLGFTVERIVDYLNRHQAWPPLTLWPASPAEERG